jgi:glucosamine kinase
MPILEKSVLQQGISRWTVKRIMHGNTLLLGVDGGATQCRARLTGASGAKLGEATGGPANIRFGLEQSFAAILDATRQCLRQAGLGDRDLSRIVACLALAGASEPTDLAAAQRYDHPFARLLVTADAHAACVGAHRGRDGGVIVVGTGTVGWAEVNGRHHRVGGWGLPISDEGSGAWLGCEALRAVLWAHDGRIEWSELLTTLFQRFQSDPHAIVRWAAQASPRDFGSLAPLIVEHAAHDDPVAVELTQRAAAHVDALADRLVAFGVERLALVGGLAPHIAPRLSATTERRLVPPADDALAGALQLARTAAGSLAA